MKIQVIKISEKGRVTLPIAIRKDLGLVPGSKIAVCWEDGAMVLKPLNAPIQEGFQAFLDKAKIWAEEAGYLESDVQALIQETRSK